MEKFLAENGDASIRDILKENDVDDLEVLASMTESDFEKLGIISFGKRRKLVLAIQKLKSIGQNHEPSEQQQGPCDVPVALAYEDAAGDGPSLPDAKRKSNIDLREALSNTFEGKVLCKHLDNGQTLSSKQRIMLVKIAVACLVEKYGLWPPSEQKTLLAKNIVNTWPSTKDTTPMMAGHIDWMKFSPPNPTTMKKHITYFKETFHYRRAFIANLDHSVTDVLDVFPRVQDVDALIAIDFSMMHGDLTADTFISKWSSFREKVMQVGRKEENVTQLVERFKMLTDVDTVCSRVDAVRYLFYNVPEGTHVEGAIEEIKEKGYRQPLIVTIGPPMKPTQFWICLDHIPVPGGSSVVESFDKLFKSFFVFGLDYPPVLMNFYEYFAAFVYEVSNASAVKPLVRTFASSVKAVE
ncbi:uncharacterized protein [Amphiura filiformis]|uniref:uncharacterized protein n=1 Tax=Amphiura filiformis TaxID=82378 RepID=UPI003B20E03E